MRLIADILYMLRPGCLLNTARRVRKTWTWPGKLRQLGNFWYNGETCNRCGRRYSYLLWWCPDNELFARLTGKVFTPPYVGGLFCPRCFDRLARAADITLEWNPRVFIDRSVTPARVASPAMPHDSEVLWREAVYWRERALEAERGEAA